MPQFNKINLTVYIFFKFISQWYCIEYEFIMDTFCVVDMTCLKNYNFSLSIM